LPMDYRRLSMNHRRLHRKRPKSEQTTKKLHAYIILPNLIQIDHLHQRVIGE
jgi:hypothetical protein